MSAAEEWRPVEGWPYEVSDRARVRNTRNGYILKTPHIHGGYASVELSCDGASKSFFVHRLIATAFNVGGSGPIVRHLDGDQNNNDLSNLRWGTAQENSDDQRRHGTHAETAKTHCDHGHELSGANLGYNSRGARICVTCRRIRSRESYSRRHPPRVRPTILRLTADEAQAIRRALLDALHESPDAALLKAVAEQIPAPRPQPAPLRWNAA